MVDVYYLFQGTGAAAFNLISFLVTVSSTHVTETPNSHRNIFRHDSGG